MKFFHRLKEEYFLDLLYESLDKNEYTIEDEIDLSFNKKKKEYHKNKELFLNKLRMSNNINLI
jgi:hypothetical protein